MHFFNEYMTSRQWANEQKEESLKYLNFLLDKSRGNIPTAATYIRGFVQKHPDYKKDSHISQSMTCDLLRMLRTANDPTSEAA